jgi:hypothetical protein
MVVDIGADSVVGEIVAVVISVEDVCEVIAGATFVIVLEVVDGILEGAFLVPVVVEVEIIHGG